MPKNGKPIEAKKGEEKTIADAVRPKGPIDEVIERQKWQHGDRVTIGLSTTEPPTKSLAGVRESEGEPPSRKD